MPALEDSGDPGDHAEDESHEAAEEEDLEHDPIVEVCEDPLWAHKTIKLTARGFK